MTKAIAEPIDMTVRKEQLRHAVRFTYDLQKLRIQQGNRAGPKAEGAEAELGESQKKFLAKASETLHDIEEDGFKEVKRLLKGVPIYEHWLKNQKGVGPAMAGIIVSEIDIARADTASKLWAFCGLAVENTLTAIAIKNATPDDLEAVIGPETMAKLDLLEFGGELIVSAKADLKTSELKLLEQSLDSFEWSEVITGTAQRRKKGEKAKYNPWMKSKMLTVLGGSFIKSNSPWRKFYDDYKARKQNQQVRLCMLCKGTKVFDKKPCGNCNGTGGPCAWGRSDAHRHQASLRYMVKMFLLELHKQWRTLEGLPLRPPYAEQYLGIKHHENPTDVKETSKDPE